MLKFEWDDAKAQANLSKHGVSFEEAASSFGDRLVILWRSPSTTQTILLARNAGSHSVSHNRAGYLWLPTQNVAVRFE